jgi:hypothetical protein
MHEVLITKGDVGGNDFDVQLLINDACNVVLIHEGDCHIKAQHIPEYEMLCMKQIVKYQGIEKILMYVNFVQNITMTRLTRAWNLINEYNSQQNFF